LQDGNWLEKGQQFASLAAAGPTEHVGVRHPEGFGEVCLLRQCNVAHNRARTSYNVQVGFVGPVNKHVSRRNAKAPGVTGFLVMSLQDNCRIGLLMTVAGNYTASQLF
jgi:hypothetical protein